MQTIHKLKYNSEKKQTTQNSRLLQHSARKRGGLILQRSRVHSPHTHHARKATLKRAFPSLNQQLPSSEKNVIVVWCGPKNLNVKAT